MTDQEMLELAAKAAGYEKDWQWNLYWLSSAGGSVKIDNAWHKWNPLTDDGDALRLAVKLGIVVEYRREVPMAFAYHYALNLEVGERNTSLDGFAATRRAIVRAAAEIGRNMA